MGYACPEYAHERSCWTGSMSKTPVQESVRNAQTRLMQLITGFVGTQAVHVAAQLGIADLIAAERMTAEQLAAATGAHAASLYRVLRYLAGADVFHEDKLHRFSLTEAGKLLQTEGPMSVHAAALLLSSPLHWKPMGEMLYSVTTGKDAFHQVYRQSYFEHTAQHPEDAKSFNAWMTRSSQMQIPAILASYDFSGCRKIIDVGGGQGALLAGILSANPGTTGVLYDVAPVIGSAQGISGVRDRCEAVAGDFFESVPGAGDAYLLCQILHDWNDERAVRILGNCRNAMNQDGRVLLIEQVVPPGNAPHPSKVMDLSMMVMFGGRERYIEEYSDLLHAARLKLNRLVSTPSPLFIIEAVAACVSHVGKPLERPTYITASWLMR